MATNVDTATTALTSASVTPPSTTAFLNLSAYMYLAYDTPYSSTPLESAIGFAPMMNNGAPVLLVDNPNGVYAQAFESTGAGPKQVIVAYEGTKSFFQGNQFTAGQLVDDTQLWAGKFADSFNSSADFASQVVAIAASQGIPKDEVFVTGHSLGAADAEYAASAVGLGGAAFAGPGINTAFTGDLPPTITDYVDAGDPVGNYAADGNNVLAPVLVSDDIKHYGNLDVLPNLTGQLILSVAAAVYESGGPRDKQAAFLGAIATAGKYHEVSNYAADLKVTLYVLDQSEGADGGFFGGSGNSGNLGAQPGSSSDYLSGLLLGASGIDDGGAAAPRSSYAFGTSLSLANRYFFTGYGDYSSGLVFAGVTDEGSAPAPSYPTSNFGGFNGFALTNSDQFGTSNLLPTNVALNSTLAQSALVNLNP